MQDPPVFQKFTLAPPEASAFATIQCEWCVAIPALSNSGKQPIIVERNRTDTDTSSALRLP
jgi:hypothetical protein